MIDPFTLRYIAEIKHQERLEQYACRRRVGVELEIARPTVAARVPRVWAALLRRLSPVSAR